MHASAAGPIAGSSSTRIDVDAAVPDARPTRLWRRLIWTWIAFWLLMMLLGTQEYLDASGRQLWRPVIDYGTAALVATALAVVQMRRSRRYDPWLGRPARWFVRMWAWMPVQLVAFVAAMHLLRWGFCVLADIPFRVDLRPEQLAYEAVRFCLFYALLGGIQFGLRSYQAWVAERLRTEQQARLAQQAQLAQLTQQLQPHFLFNALNTVSSLIHSDPDTADALLTRLATLPDDGPALVFVTAFDRYALQAFDTHASDYLLKPIEPERLERTLGRLRVSSRTAARPGAPAPPERLFIVDRGATHVVRCADIEWLQAADNYVNVHLKGQTLLMRRTLESLLKDLAPAFIRTHRSAAVALACVQALRPRGKGDATVVLHSGAEVPCSRQHRAALMRHLQR